MSTASDYCSSKSKNLVRLPLLAIVLFALVVAPASAELAPSTTTQLVILGTGTPNPHPDRSGPAVAVVVNGTPYLVDFGPGVVRRAAAMSPAYGGQISGLDVKGIKRAFLTHLHSDHTTGLPDLVFTPWTMGRDEPLEIYGPEGIVEMVDHVLAGWQEDVRYRVYGLQPANNDGWRVNAHVVEEGIVYEDDNVKVEAFPVVHGSWPNAVGYRFTTPDRVIVISGDAAPSASIEKYSNGVDILVHEVYAAKLLAERGDEFWQKYYEKNHTSGAELGLIAERAQPKLLVLYHYLPSGVNPQQILDEVREIYAGDVVAPDDMDVF